MTAATMSRDKSGREFFTHADVPIYAASSISSGDATAHPWIVMPASDATDEELQSWCLEFPDCVQTHPDSGEVHGHGELGY